MANKFFFKIEDYLLSVLSACLLIFAFPKTDVWILAWIGLVPLFLALDGKIPKKAFFIGFLHGLVFFSSTMFWLINVDPLVAYFGYPLIVIVLSLYLGFFGLGYSYFYRFHPTLKLILIPSLWVGLEFLRAHLFSGFSWASLCLSQYKNLVMIQIADLTGMFGVSFIIVVCNLAIKDLIKTKAIFNSEKFTFEIVINCIIGAALVLGTGAYGLYSLGIFQKGENLNVAVIQANTPQELKWDKVSWPTIMLDYTLLTQDAVVLDPELIIWPETSFPGMIGDEGSRVIMGQLKDTIKDAQIPFLIGSIVKKEEDKYYNAALLFSKDGEILKQYSKHHLVPFGEYVPFRSVLPFIDQIVPIGDFSSGTEYTLFPSYYDGQTKKPSGLFAVLICFEDSVPGLVRKFVNEGAQFLVNITNDAWFKDTKAPFMHVQSSVFRAIENRKYVVRAANTGVSCFINDAGKILNSVHDKNGKETFISGVTVTRVRLNSTKTFYTRYGDVFSFACFGLMSIFIFKRFAKK